MSFSAHSPINSRLSSSRLSTFVRERKAATRKHFRRTFFEQLEARQVMAAMVDTTIGGGTVGDTLPGGGTFYDQHLDTWDGSKVVASDPRVQAWQTADFTTDTFLVRFQNSVSRVEAEATLAAQAPGASIKTWDDEMHLAWVSLPQGSTREDVLQTAHHFLGLSNTLYAEPDITFEYRRIPNDPQFPLQWQLNNTGQGVVTSFPTFPGGSYQGPANSFVDVNAPEAWDLTTGSPDVIVAVLDSGFNFFEPDLRSSYWVNPNETYDMIDNDGNGVVDDVYGYDAANLDGDPQDDAVTAHGLEVGSIIAAPGNDGVGMTGISWNSKVMHVRIENAVGQITAGGVVGAMRYVTKMKIYGHNIVAANLSFGGPTFVFSQFEALKQMGNQNVLIVTAAANQGYNHDIYFDSPTGYDVDQIISVTASNVYDESQVVNPGFYFPNIFPDFGYGASKVDIAAPGIDVMLTGFRYAVGPGISDNLNISTGTSFASPLVAGTAALMKSLAPYLTALELKQLIISSAVKTPYYNNLNVADGRLDVFAALNAIPKTTISGTVFQDVNSDKVQGVGETGLGGATVYLDLDNDGVFDANEPSTVTVTNTGTTGPLTGSYTFDAWLNTGTYRVRQVLQTGFSQTTPTTNGGANVLTVGTRGQDFTNVNFGARQQTGSISGTKFLDTNANGTRELGEPGLAGVLFFVDLNNNRRINVGEPAAYTDANGNFTIPNIPPGEYEVREVLGGGYIPTVPTTVFGGLPDPVLPVTVVSNTTTTPPLLFGNRAAFDYGDLPESIAGVPVAYNTTIARGGPSHGILPGFMLGNNIDAETNGQPSPTALGDDQNPSTGQDDEDGLLGVSLVQGQSGVISLRVSNGGRSSGYVQAWIDFGNDGSFAQPGDQILRNFVPVNGDNLNIPFAIPAGITPGVVYARIRYSYDFNLGPDGPARAGEVEDYQFTIFADRPIAIADYFPHQLFGSPVGSPITPDPLIQQESVNNELDVLRNDPPPSTGTLSIVTANFPLNTGNGIVTVGTNASGKQVLFYTPNGGAFPFTGIDTFTYTVTNGTDVSAAATVQVYVTAKDPRLVDDTFVMVGNVPSNPAPQPVSLTMDVVRNDVNTPSAPISLNTFTQPIYPAGVVISGPTVTKVGNNLVITPPAGFVGTVQFTYTVTDSDPNTNNDRSATVTVQVTANPSPPAAAPDLQYKAIISLEVVDSNGVVQGTPGFRIDRNDAFSVRIYAEDIRPGGSNADRGVEAAFVDLLYDRNLVSVNFNGANPDIVFAPTYQLDKNNIVNSPEGIINELGAVHQKPIVLPPNPPAPPVGLGKKLVATVKFTAIASGSFVFRADPAEDSQDRSQILLAEAVGGTDPIPVDDKEVFLIPTPLVEIKEPGAPEFVNERDSLDVNADTRITAFDAIAIINDLNAHGTRRLRDYDLASAGELPPGFFVDTNNDGMISAFDAIRVINWLNQHPVSGGEAAGSGGEAIAAASAPESAGEATGESNANSSPVVGPLEGHTTSRSASERLSPRTNSQQDDSALLYLTAVDQLMSGGEDASDIGSSSAQEESLSDWLNFGGRLRGVSTVKKR